jgi:argininosuccinate synthase
VYSLSHSLPTSIRDNANDMEPKASMDSLEGFSPVDTTGFIAIQGIRLEKYGAAKIQRGEPLTRTS